LYNRRLRIKGFMRQDLQREAKELEEKRAKSSSSVSEVGSRSRSQSRLARFIFSPSSPNTRSRSHSRMSSHPSESFETPQKPPPRKLKSAKPPDLTNDPVGRLQFLYSGYRPEYYWWEAVVVLRKVSLIALSVFFLGELQIQCIIASALVCLAWIAHSMTYPFKDGSLNKWEFMSLFVSFSVFIGGQLFFASMGQAMNQLVSVVLALIVMTFIVAAVREVVRGQLVASKEAVQNYLHKRKKTNVEHEIAMAELFSERTDVLTLPLDAMAPPPPPDDDDNNPPDDNPPDDNFDDKKSNDGNDEQPPPPEDDMKE
jgi:hypothetical protein